MADAIDPATWTDPALQRALARRDVPAVYRLLTAAGMTQRRIAELTGQGQSEVSEILHGRYGQSYNVLARIADGLGVPRAGWAWRTTAPALATRHPHRFATIHCRPVNRMDRS